MIELEDLPVGRRERNKQDKLRRIVAAARELFHSKGYEATTLQDISDRADVGTGTLFLHVDGKEDLLILSFVDELTAVVVSAHAKVDRERPFADQAHAFFCSMFDYHRQDTALSSHLIRAVTILRNKERRADIERIPLRPLFDGLIEAALEKGEIDADLAVEQVGVLMFAAYLHCLNQWVNAEIEAEVFASRLRAMIDLQMRGMGPRPRAG